MERLTERNDRGSAYYPRCFEGECAGTEGQCKKECEFNIKICEKIAEYEDLGVTPEQIREMDKAFLEKCEEINRLKNELEKLSVRKE